MLDTLLTALLLLPAAAHAATVTVDPGGSIQAAIAAATDGDVIALHDGIYDGDIDFLGKAVRVVGTGPDTVIRGTGTGPVVRFASGETPASVLDSCTITGGVAAQGGGIYIANSSPTVVRNVVFRNRASGGGSGIYVTASSADILNNLVIYNGTAGGDPHSVEINGAGARVVNNTIARGDSNGIILRGTSPALIMNNVIAFNGSSPSPGDRRGRGICDFSGGLATIHYNLFFRNRRAALLTSGRDFWSIRRAEREIGAPRLLGNLDGSPGFVRRVPPRLGSPEADVLDVGGFTLRAMGKVRALHAGNPDPAFNDRDGTRNTLGFTGGPQARP